MRYAWLDGLPVLNRAFGPADFTAAGAPLDLGKTCDATPVAREYALGQSIGVRGTPAIVTERGDYIAGYMPPRELVQQLKDLQVAKR